MDIRLAAKEAGEAKESRFRRGAASPETRAYFPATHARSSGSRLLAADLEIVYALIKYSYSRKRPCQESPLKTVIG